MLSKNKRKEGRAVRKVFSTCSQNPHPHSHNISRWPPGWGAVIGKTYRAPGSPSADFHFHTLLPEDRPAELFLLNSISSIPPTGLQTDFRFDQSEGELSPRPGDLGTMSGGSSLCRRRLGWRWRMMESDGTGLEVALGGPMRPLQVRGIPKGRGK